MNPSIDNSVSEAIKRSGKISLTKNIALPEHNNFGVIYYESVNSVFVLYKFYLEVFCCVIFNNVLKKS